MTEKGKWTEDMVRRMVVNLDHIGTVGKEQWVSANERIVAEVGLNAYLKLLVEVNVPAGGGR